MKTARLLILAALLCSACTPADSRAEPPAASARSQQTQGAAMQLTINNRSLHRRFGRHRRRARTAPPAALNADPARPPRQRKTRAAATTLNHC